jgi:hypothetical protein
MRFGPPIKLMRDFGNVKHFPHYLGGGDLSPLWYFPAYHDARSNTHEITSSFNHGPRTRECPWLVQGLVTFAANKPCQCPKDATGLSGGASRFSLATVAASSNDRNHPRDKPVAFDVRSVGCCSNERNQPPGEPVAFDAL